MAQYSPDGRFWWNGQQWIPVATAPQPGYPYGAMAISPKSPGLAVLASFFIPGLGSMISGSAEIGAVILVCWLISIPLVILFGLGIITGLACWIFGMYHAYESARKWNLARGIIS